MSTSSLSLKYAFLFSLSLAGVTSFTYNFAVPQTKLKSIQPFSPSPKPKATVSDLLSLLGPPQQAHSVNSQVARDIWSCFKFLVPFPPYNQTVAARRSLILSSNLCREDIDELILSPPTSVLELARLAVDSGADPGAIHRALDPTTYPVPDVEGSNEDRCELTRTDYGRRFVNEVSR